MTLRARGIRWVVTAIVGLAGTAACGGGASPGIEDATVGDGATADVSVREDGSGRADATVPSDTGTGDGGREADALSGDSDGKTDGSPRDSGEKTDGSDAGGDSSGDAGKEASDSGALDGNEGGANVDAEDSASDVTRDAGEDMSDSRVDATLCGADVDGAPVNHRPDDSQCLQPAPPGDCPGTLGACGADAGSPGSDSLCTAGVGGRCDFGRGFCTCTYDTCADDTECEAGALCACHESAYSSGGNTCAPGNCRVDSDCGDGGYCSPSQATGTEVCSGGGCGGTCGGGLTGYYCHTPSDECSNDCDCYGDTFTVPDASMRLEPICAWSSASSRWTCQGLFRCP